MRLHPKLPRHVVAQPALDEMRLARQQDEGRPVVDRTSIAGDLPALLEQVFYLILQACWDTAASVPTARHARRNSLNEDEDANATRSSRVGSRRCFRALRVHYRKGGHEARRLDILVNNAAHQASFKEIASHEQRI